jgi:hypothetical protein
LVSSVSPDAIRAIGAVGLAAAVVTLTDLEGFIAVLVAAAAAAALFLLGKLLTEQLSDEKR